MPTYQPVSSERIVPNSYPPVHEVASTASFETRVGDDTRLSRTPSPTPSEVKELQSSAVDWKSLATKKFWFRRDWLCTLSLLTSFQVMIRTFVGPGYYVALVVILIISALIIIYHTQIVDWLTPVARWMHKYVYFNHLSSMFANVIKF